MARGAGSCVGMKVGGSGISGLIPGVEGGQILTEHSRSGVAWSSGSGSRLSGMRRRGHRGGGTTRGSEIWAFGTLGSGEGSDGEAPAMA